jgi:uncharacterized protein (DUF2141 family)
VKATLLSLVAATALLVQNATLTVVIRNVRNANGVVRVALFSREKDYMKDFSTSRVVPAAKGEVTVSFDALPPGDYAITVFHDENNNGKLDSNFFHIPKEGVGFSNDASATFGPPSWAKAKFTVSSAPAKQVITLKYF